MAEVIENRSDSAIGYKKPPVTAQFKPGASANPGGKPTKSRNALSAKFFKDLAADFDKHGKAAIKEARESDPMRYIQTIASLMPKEFAIAQPLEDLTDEQLDAAMVAARAILSASHDGIGEGGAGQAQPSKVLPPVSETA